MAFNASFILGPFKAIFFFFFSFETFFCLRRVFCVNIYLFFLPLKRVLGVFKAILGETFQASFFASKASFNFDDFLCLR